VPVVAMHGALPSGQTSTVSQVPRTRKLGPPLQEHPSAQQINPSLQPVGEPAQAPEHWPATHCSLNPHPVPQPPQFEGSLLVSTQVPLQLVRLSGQHAPLVQFHPAGQTRAQAPQLFSSSERRTHWPRQFVHPSGQRPWGLPPPVPRLAMAACATSRMTIATPRTASFTSNEPSDLEFDIAISRRIT
jgi:hypothetical protein